MDWNVGHFSIRSLLPCTDDSSGSEAEEEGEEEVAAQKDATVVDAAVSDMEYLRSRMTSKFEESASDEEAQDGGLEDAGAVPKPSWCLCYDMFSVRSSVCVNINAT